MQYAAEAEGYAAQAMEYAAEAVEKVQEGQRKKIIEQLETARNKIDQAKSCLESVKRESTKATNAASNVFQEETEGYLLVGEKRQKITKAINRAQAAQAKAMEYAAQAAEAVQQGEERVKIAETALLSFKREIRR